MVGSLPAHYTLSLFNQNLGFQFREKQYKDFCATFNYKDSHIMNFFETRKTQTVYDKTSGSWATRIGNIFQRPKNSVGKRWSWNGPLRLLIDSRSASHGRAWETGDNYIIRLNTDHSSMVKFTENDWDGYKKIQYILERFVKAVYLVINTRIGTSPANSIHTIFYHPRFPKG